MPTVDDVREVTLPRFTREDGDLAVAEYGKQLPFQPLRLFTVSGNEGALRGQHAHRWCTQFLMCVHGTIEVMCDDGTYKRGFVLDCNDKGLLIPPGIWAEETYRSRGVLAVLCDRLFEEADYLRDYAGFLAWRKDNA
jgi:dTDP-4-dehydrorhamnose 3,5-epimerase-like enzyme